jgi:hypothetical protein
MGERRILVIGSQCAALTNSQLPFVPHLAEELYQVMTDPDVGQCAPALQELNAPLLDPTVEEAKARISAAIARGSRDAATLFLAYIGHGEHIDEDFYLLPRDASVPPDSESAVLLAPRLRELLRRHDGLDGLVLLVDACHAGIGAIEAGATWPRTIAQAGGRFEVLTSADAREAADGCFTAALIQLLRSGDASFDRDLRCADLKTLVQRSCTKQVATYLAFDGRFFTRVGDEGLWLVRNRARRPGSAPLAETPVWREVERLTTWFERVPKLDELVEASLSNRCVAVVGPAGQGKSTLVAALARSELADDLLPARFVHALSFAASTTSEADLARDLSVQLSATLDGFHAAQAVFGGRASDPSRAGLSTLEQQVVGPLRQLPAGRIVRLVVDGLDQLTTETTAVVGEALAVLTSDPELAHVRLIVTARPDIELPARTHILTADPAARVHLERYLSRRGVRSELVPVITDRAAGNWLVARLVADVALDSETAVGLYPATLSDGYREELRRAGADEPVQWAKVRPVLAALAVAGVGPVLPLPLLCRASGLLGGPSEPARVRDVLVRLRGLVARGAPGTADEHDGLFHATLAEFLFDDDRLGIDERTAHEALANAIADLAPMDIHNPRDPLHQYAAASEAEHLWAAGRYELAPVAIATRNLGVVAEDFIRWVWWRAHLQERRLGPDHPDTLATRANIAFLTGQAGDTREALRLLHQLLPDQQRVLGPDHPNTLATRARIRHSISRRGGGL